MSRRSLVGIIGGLGGLVLLVGIIGSEVQGPAASPIATTDNINRGNIGQYLYVITSTSQNNKMAQFDPSLPADEDKVLEALKVVAKAGYGLDIAAEAQPVVVAQDEKNYVTFKVPGKTAFFELFKNASGELGTVRFWAED